MHVDDGVAGAGNLSARRAAAAVTAAAASSGWAIAVRRGSSARGAIVAWLMDSLPADH